MIMMAAASMITLGLVTQCGGEVLAGSASNWASLEDPAILAGLERSPRLWERFLVYETAACASPGVRDGGTRILFAARRATPL
ncbi:hypothetical protein [Kitasatospora sp. NPDC056531]|uniref:hypothetical protein n=1 Tax=Kitasatospora sp. NPDC056531 TaxID=3345856 RepID=UPI003693CB70